jgi:signal transduction histidine kinase/CheY-like chemotaxis protein
MSSRASDRTARRTKDLLRVFLRPLARLRSAWLGFFSVPERKSAAEDPLAPELRAELDRLVDLRTEELEHRNAELVRSKERADELLHARSDLLASLSHEIRTPMNAVIGMANVLLATDLSSKQRALADRILRSSESLLHLLNDFLDFSRIDSGKIELEQIECCPREIVEECLDLLTQMAQSKCLDLALWVDPAVPERVIGDPGRLRQILLNLINNAVKFTERGFVSVELLASPSAGRAVELQIRVRDSGIGIAEHRLATLFQRYVQADASMARKFGGCGLGLAISRRLCELMGGTVSATSELGKGSTFVLKLPVGTPARVRHCRDLLPDELSGMSVLLVHHEGESARILVRQLEALGCLVQHERSVLAALACLDSGAARDVTLFDATLPGSAELASLEGDRSAAAAGRMVRLVGLFRSADGARADSPLVAELGEPVKILELVDALVEARGLAPLARPSIARTSAADPSLRETRSRRSVRILVAEDEPSNQDLLRWVLNERSFQVEVVSNGSDAVEAYRARPHDLVLMDMSMPVMGGLAATRAIRLLERQLGSRVPILALTANVLREDRERCRAAGMDEFVTKPFRPAELLERVDALLGTGDVEEIASALPRASEQGVLAASPVAEMLADPEESSRELAASMIAGFLERAPRMLGELEGLLATEDLAGAAELAHGYISVSGNMGAATLVAALRELELACKSRKTDVSRAALPRVRAELERAVIDVRGLRDRRGEPFPS